MSALPLILLGALSLTDFNAQLESVNPEFQSELAKEVKATVDELGAPGATAAVVIDGKLVAATATGIRKVGSATALQVTDPMHVGSITKGMTALLVARLEEQKVMNWTSTLAQAFPKMANMDEAFLRVPISELAYQRSGIPDNKPNEMFDLYRLPVEEARAQYAARTLAIPPEIRPGSDFRYRNGNFMVLGAAIEEATGRSWEELVRAEVFKPLGMKRAGFGPMGTGKGIEVPWQHRRTKVGLQPIYADNPPFVGPAGTVHCSVLDLANYAYAWIAGLKGDDSYLPLSSWKFLTTPPPGSPSYACGLVIDPDSGSEGIKRFGHAGSNTFSHADWRESADGRLLVIGMLNAFSEKDTLLCDRLEKLGAKWLKTIPKPALAPKPQASSMELGKNLLEGAKPISLLQGDAKGGAVTKPDGVRFDVDQTGQYAWEATLAFLAIGLEEGKRYLLTFDAKATTPRKVELAAEQHDRPHDNCGLEGSFDCGIEWAGQSFTFTARHITGGQVRVPAFFLGREKGAFWCRNVRLSEILR